MEPPPDAPETPATARVLDEAERQFLERGYAGTRLADLAAALGMRTASLYHHAPGGKAELWRRVRNRALDRHRDALRAAALAAGPDLGAALEAMAGWLLSRPPVNVIALATSGPAAAPAPDARETSERLYEGLMVPVAEVFRRAQARGDAVSDQDADLLAGVFVAAVTAIGPAARAGALPRPAEDIGRDVVRLLLDGLRPR